MNDREDVGIEVLWLRILCYLIWFIAIYPICLSAQIEPAPVGQQNLSSVPYSSVGVVLARGSVGTRRGTAFEAYAENTIITAAHVARDCENDDWRDLRFFPRYYSQNIPIYDDGYRLLGPYDSTSYAEIYRQLKLDSLQNGFDCNSAPGEVYNRDFAVFFSYEPVSETPHLSLTSSPEDALLSDSIRKLVVGYPNVDDGDNGQGPDEFWLFESGAFSSAFERSFQSYFLNREANTYEGNSGGPALVEEAGVWRVAGVLVSGRNGVFVDDLIGVKAIDGDAIALLNEVAQSRSIQIVGNVDELQGPGISFSDATLQLSNIEDPLFAYAPILNQEYRATNIPAGWSGTVTPVGDGRSFVFEPRQRSYVNLTSSILGQNYVATEAIANFSAGEELFAVGENVQLTFSIRAFDGQGLAGESIRFKTSFPGNFSGCTPGLDGCEAVTDSAGRAEVSFVGSVAGQAEIEASHINGITRELTLGFEQLSFNSLTASPNPVDVDNPASITADLGSLGAGQPVTFSTSHPGFFPGAVTRSITVTANSFGIASTTFSPTSTGSALITVESPTIGAATVTLEVVDPAANSIPYVTATYDSGGPSSTSYTIRVRLTDLAGNPLSGEPVNLATTRGTLDTNRVITGSTGTDSARLTVTSSGTTTVTATHNGASSSTTRASSPGDSRRPRRRRGKRLPRRSLSTERG